MPVMADAAEELPHTREERVSRPILHDLRVERDRPAKSVKSQSFHALNQGKTQTTRNQAGKG